MFYIFKDKLVNYCNIKLDYVIQNIIADNNGCKVNVDYMAL